MSTHPKTDFTNYQDDCVGLCKLNKVAQCVSVRREIVTGSLMDGRIDALTLTWILWGISGGEKLTVAVVFGAEKNKADSFFKSV